MQLQFVGCGDAFGSGGRFNTCSHLTGDTTNLLIDCGASSLIALKRYLAVRIEAEGKVVTYTGDSEWTPELVGAGRGADLFVAEAYFRDKTIATHLSLNAIEAHLDQIGPKRLVLTHMSDDMLNHPDRLLFETAEDGMILTLN